MFVIFRKINLKMTSDGVEEMMRTPVEAECEVNCIVDKGIVAPGFGSIGGAAQYRHYRTIRESLEIGILEKDYG